MNPTHTMAFEMDDEVANRLGLHYEQGWVGIISRHEDPDALYKNGSRIRKNRSERGDVTPLGTEGTVLGSIRAPGHHYCGYFVEWDNKPKVSVFVGEWKLAPAARKERM